MGRFSLPFSGWATWPIRYITGRLQTIDHKRLSEFVEENIEAISSLSDICEALHYSKNYVERICNREFGVSPIQYVNDMKIKKAMYLLETTSKPITSVSEECGYVDYAYFYKRFVQKTGLSPSKWRGMIRNDPLNRGRY